ncbi:MAG: aminodeoxychorismate synthase component I [Sedimenticola sp.]|nr:aminodeoxychorismate synthase component I [Sedimenticola sp.]
MVMQSPPPRELPYSADTSRLFDAIASRPWAVFLDSGVPGTRQGRYDILTCDPQLTLVTRGSQTRLREADGRIQDSTGDPLELLQQALRRHPRLKPGPLPFQGGAIGYFSYDLGRRFERLPELAGDSDRLPEMAVGIYDLALVVDHHNRKSWIVGSGSEARRDRLIRLLDDGRPDVTAPFRVVGEVESNMTRDRYAEAFSRVQRFIRDGDCYQVNLAQRFSVRTEGDPWTAYRRLRQLSPAPFAGYLNLPFCQVLSSSPERFLSLRESRVETWPIKGTAPRGSDRASDRENREGLLRSDKDRAENLMIVDLLRNDLGRSCRPGSISVDSLFSVESYATVHHLVSRISGSLAPGQDGLDLLRGCFPGGSITGAPKLRAMEIIEQLEPHRRGVYCGSLGYIGWDGNMDTSIAIRTMLHIDGRMRLWAGGGLVADSRMEDEYQETYHKARAMLQLLQEHATPSMPACR